MLRGNNLAWLRRELGTDLATPRAVFEALSHPRCLLNGCNVFPALVVSRTVSMMQCIEDSKLPLPRGIQDLQHRETQSFASATARIRSHILPPSEIKSLYG